MSAAFAFGLAVGAAIVVFGRDTAVGRSLLLRLHLGLALLQRWLSGRRR